MMKNMGSLVDESHGINLKFIQTIIFFSLLLSQSIASDDGLMVSTTCLNPNQTETNNNHTDDGFQTNLDNLLNNLITTSASNASSSFYNTTVGVGAKSSEKAYGIYLCRGDATSTQCQSCVKNLTQFLITMITPGCKEQFAYADYCMTRYANYSFFGRVDKALLGPVIKNFVTTNYDAYNRTLDGVVKKVISDAAYNNTMASFATSEGSVNSIEKVYALAQCTPDITKGDCYDCLKATYAYNFQRPNNSGILKGAWYMLASCQLRFDNTTFYQLSAAVPSNFSPAVTSNSLPFISVFLLVVWSLLLLF